MRLRLRKNKKGSIQDLVTIAIILFFFSIVTLIGFKLNDELKTQFEDNDFQKDIQTSSARNINATMRQTNSMFTGVLDNGFLFLVVGLGCMALVLASLVRIHPIFFVFYIIVLTIVIFLCGIFSTVYNEIATQPEFASLAAQLVFINHIMTYLPLFIGVFGTLLGVVMYKLFAFQTEEAI